jgi:hypothetical protein
MMDDYGDPMPDHPSHFQYDGQQSPATKKVWVNFKPDIDLGHVIAACTFLGGLFLYAQGFDRRLTIIEQKEEANAAQAGEMKSDLKEIKKAVNEIGTNLAVQNAVNQTRKP